MTSPPPPPPPAEGGAETTEERSRAKRRSQLCPCLALGHNDLHMWGVQVAGLNTWELSCASFPRELVICDILLKSR